MSLVLAIDTASEPIALALGEPGGEVATAVRASDRDHSRRLLAMLDELVGGRRQEIGAIVAVRGPGNYSGLRVGLATARGLSLSLGVPLLGVETMLAVAHAAGLEGEWLAIHPAGRREFAVQPFVGLEPAGDLHPAPADELPDQPLAGEGAGERGGVEVDPEARVRAALALAAKAPPLEDALYLRAPHVTAPRSNAGPPGRG